LCEDLAPNTFDPSLSNVSVGIKNSIISKVNMNAIMFAIDLPQIVHLTLKMDIIELGAHVGKIVIGHKHAHVFNALDFAFVISLFIMQLSNKHLSLSMCTLNLIFYLCMTWRMP
jgi:hypothetical protein